MALAVRVVLFVTDLESGGTPMRLARLALGLQNAGLDVHVGCLACDGPVGAQLEAAGIPTFACAAYDQRDVDVLRRLAGHLRRIRPDLIHATLTHANVTARLVGLYLRIPVIGSTATIEVERRWHRWAERLTAPLERLHVVNSVTLAEHVTDAFWLPRRRIRVVPPSIDPVPASFDREQARRELDIPAHEFVVLWAGRLDPVKRLDLVVKCAEIMNVVPSRFLLAGDGPERLHLEQLLRLSSAAPRVHLLGWRDDLPRLMAAADAFLFPSRTEGMPNALLEAMATGLPIVASAIPALRGLGADDRMLLVPGDDPKPFADALLQLHRDEPTRREMGARAAAWAAAHLRPADTINAVVRVYREVLRARWAGRSSSHRQSG